jgi:hypothetical protein
VTKAFTDAGTAASFADAEARLDAVSVCVHVGADQAFTPAGQAAALTVVATAYKCFGRVCLVIEVDDPPLVTPLYIGLSLAGAACRLGAAVYHVVPPGTTHTVQIGSTQRWSGWWVQCWWDRWLAGTRMVESGLSGDSRMPLAGVFAGALAVRQVFANIRFGSSARISDVTVSLWEPWAEANSEAVGPMRFTAPDFIWLVGLGHLGQSFVWNLLMLPYLSEQRRVVLQDDQRIGAENEATSLLVTEKTIGERKVRIASDWLEAGGWETILIERRHHGDITPLPEDPPFLLCGLDELPPRRILAGTGFDYMIDAGIGHGPTDFEGIQIRVIPKGASTERLWSVSERVKENDQLLSNQAYKALEAEIGACGTYSLANASVAVPFVGAATGALAIAQLIRLASMNPGGILFQLELGAPEMVIDGGRTPPPQVYLGGETMQLVSAL